MRIAWDKNKDAINRRVHGIGFDVFGLFFKGEIIVVPAKTVDGELRWQVMGEINGQVMTAIYAMRGTWYRVMSMRNVKHRGKEIRLFRQSQKTRKEKGRVPHQL